MKPIISVALAAIFLLASCGQEAGSVNTSIQGKWSQTHTHDDKTYHDFVAWFKKDGSYDGIEDGKVVVAGGRYEQRGDTIILNDATCNPHNIGIYKLIFFPTDSLRFELIQDSCTPRREGTAPFRFKRMAM